MPQDMLLIYSSNEARPSEAELQAEMPKWFEYTQALQESGAMDALEPADTATTVRVRDGETLLGDGPFAETTENLGGYYLVDVPDLDAALAWAAKIANVVCGSVEVRPVVVFDQTAMAGG